VEQLFTEIDQISETADDDRTQEILGALYDYAEHIVPER
jgi:exodeoxyribonuclease-1